MSPSKTFINYADYMLAITDKFWHHSFLSLIFQFVWGLYISAPAAVDLQLNPSRASAVENVRISPHHGSWRGHEACSGSDSCTTCGHLHPAHLEDPWRSPTNSSSLLSLRFIIVFIKIAGRFIFVFIKIAGSDLFRCESLRCAIFLFTSFQNSHEIQLYRFTTSCKTTRRVVCQLVLHKTNNDVSSLFGSCTTHVPDPIWPWKRALFVRALSGERSRREAPFTPTMSDSQIKLCVAYNWQQRDTI